MTLIPPQIITRPKQLKRLVARLARCPAIGVDTESNNAFAYYERVCLIQLSTATVDYLVDPLAIDDLAPLGKIFADAKVEKIFHDAHYDLMCLKRDYGFTFANLFDTMWATRILGREREGLSSLLQEHFAVETNKRYQRYDWGKRPLTQGAIHYAQLDTHYLIQLRDIQKRELAAQGRMSEAAEIFAEVTATPAGTHRNYQDVAPWRVRGIWDLSPTAQAVLHHLARWREREAARRDRPPFMIFNDDTLLRIAESAPSNIDELARVRGVGEYHLRRYGKTVLREVKRGLAAPPLTPPPRVVPDEAIRDRFERLQTWRKDTAVRRGVHSTVVMSKDVLWAIAKRNPRTMEQLARIERLGAWRMQEYGAEILRELSS